MPIKKPEENFHGINGPIGYLLRQAQHAIRLKINIALSEYNITHPQFAVLKVIEHESGLHAADIARVSMLSPQAVNVIIKNLETAGLINRTAHEIHGRVLEIKLTDLGKKRMQQCSRKVALIEKEMLAGLKSQEEKMIRAWLIKCTTL